VFNGFKDKNGTVLFTRVPRAKGAQNTKLCGCVFYLIQCTDATDDSAIDANSMGTEVLSGYYRSQTKPDTWLVCPHTRTTHCTCEFEILRLRRYYGSMYDEDKD